MWLARDYDLSRLWCPNMEMLCCVDAVANEDAFLGFSEVRLAPFLVWDVDEY